MAGLQMAVQPTSDVFALPAGLHVLHFGFVFNLPLHEVAWPASLPLYLGGQVNMSFSPRSLDWIVWPAGWQSRYLGRQYGPYTALHGHAGFRFCALVAL